MKKILIIVMLCGMYLSSNAQVNGFFFDSRDGQEYKTITFEIGLGDKDEPAITVLQEWMADNLNYVSENSFCYNDYLAYCEVYGRLYTWEEAPEVCPEGWHLPTSSEWSSLYRKYGSTRDAGGALLEEGESELGLKMGGFGELNNVYIDIGVNAYYWKLLDDADKGSGLIAVHSDTGEISDVEIADRHKNSIRCVKEYEEL